MFIQLLIALSMGILCGIITGLTPGIHINLLAVMLVSVSPFLLKHTSPLVLCTFIISMSVIHTFLDAIPSIFLGAPDSATALGVLPGHRYLHKGWGLMAVKLTIIGSFGAILLSVFLFPVLIPVVIFIHPFLSASISWLLLTVILFMIWSDNKRAWAVFVFFLAGSLGLVVLNIHALEHALFPLLSGLFGIATLVISLNNTSCIPEQKQSSIIQLKKSIAIRALLSGQFSGFITAVMPGLGAATAATISMQLPGSRKLGDHGFMILMGSISTANFVLSMVTLYALGKARNGSIIAVQEFLAAVRVKEVIVFLSATLIAGSAGVFLALFFGKYFSRMISKVHYPTLVWSIIGFIVIMTFILTKWLGLLILFTSTAIGIIPAIVKVRRIQAMACLLVPVLVYFSPL